MKKLYLLPDGSGVDLTKAILAMMWEMEAWLG